MRIILTIILLSQLLISEEINSIKISPLNRAYILLNGLPEYSSELNESKDRVSIKLENTSFGNIQQLNSTGIIKSITPLVNGDTSEVIIEFSSKGKGYSIAPLPYSSSLMVDVFDWDRLTDAENKYRQAIFAYEANLDNTEDELRSAIELGSSEAKAILALHYLKKSDLDSAVPLLFDAFRDSVKIPDLYAGLAEILEIKGENELSSKFAEQFKEFTGKNDYPNFALDFDSSKIQIPEYFYPKKEKALDTNKTQKELVTKVDTLQTKQDEKSLLEEFGLNPLYLIFVGIAGIILFLFIFWAYTKWKKDQINKMKEISKTRFDEEVRKAKEKNEAKAEQLRQNREKQQKEKNKSNPSILDKAYGKSKKDVEIPDLKQKKVKPVKNVEEEKKTFEIEKFLETYIPAKREMEKDKSAEEKAQDQYIDDSDDDKNKSPNAELAMRLAGEKHKKKQEQLLKLADKKKDDSDIDKTAKDMGIEKGTLETKSSISKLSEDDKRLKKLGNKFGLDSKDSEEK